MMDRPDSATLLVFTLGARRESHRRRLLPAYLDPIERQLHQACLDATLEAGRAAGCKLEVSSPMDLVLPGDVARRPQRGSDFGSRLTRAFHEAFANRDGCVVLVGSDVPDLEPAHLERSREALAEDPERVVIGPSPDGGFYLLAAARPLGELLSKVRWKGRDTLRSLRRLLQQAGRPVVLLSPLADLDSRHDLERWLASARGVYWLRASGLIRQLIAVLNKSYRAGFDGAPSLRVRRAQRVATLRGPPRLAHPTIAS